MEIETSLLPAEESTAPAQVQLFNNPAFGSVRITVIDGDPWFVAKDVCGCLEISNSRDAISKLRDKDKGVAITDTLGGKQEMATISENGLYELMFSARKPEAKQFKYWVVDEVLPAIRQQGIYATEAVRERMLTDPDYIIQVVNQWKVELAKRKAVELERDVAIRTKAYISDKKTATAMATASAATRKVAALQNQLGKGKEWKEVKAIPWLKDVFVLNKRSYIAIGKQLAMLSRNLGYDIKKIDSSEYPMGINAYHVDVIRTFFDKIQDDDTYMSSYRRFY